MIVSWNWLCDYVRPDAGPDEVARRLMMAGLNHESTDRADDDWAIDLEVTSNRPDCLGHVGVAREISVLFGVPFEIPDPRPSTEGPAVEQLAKVRIDCPNLCPRYTARVLRGVRVGPSPEWLVKRLQTLGLPTINNVVDATNYVMMECGQPLHAFDFQKLQGRRIIVREACAGEPFVAIDHRQYQLQPGMCVIADATSPVALGGVMGGAETEVSESTTDVLIEAAEFAPLSIRTTARKLVLHSPSSYRFERGVDPDCVDWASRRCCELIQQIAGGKLAPGVLDVGTARQPRQKVTLRFARVTRLLGIEVPPVRVRQILESLGNEVVATDETAVQVIPPGWRRDLSREVDLIEEVARIHGYEKIPEDAAVPMCPSFTAVRDRVARKVRQVLTATGFDEALTASLVPAEWAKAFSPWQESAPIVAEQAMKGVLSEAPKDLSPADCLRQSVVPSLLESRRYNESMSNSVIELFEMARVYLPQPQGLPREQWVLGLVSGRDFRAVKGAIEQLVATIVGSAALNVKAWPQPLLEPAQSCTLSIGDRPIGFVGQLAAKSLKQFGLRSAAVCAEINLEQFVEAANLTPQYSPLPAYPSMARDLNMVVDESLQWADLLNTVRSAAGPELDLVAYRETYRDPQKDGSDKKRLLFSITLRSLERTLTGEEADGIRDRIVAACADRHAAKLLA
jgi:phenylalanyl-tRNA synthetase beta chain